MNVVYAIAIIALFAAAVGVFFEYLLHEKYEAWWRRANEEFRRGLDSLYQERGW